MGKRVLCIGGCGYVGSAIFDRLVSHGHDVHTVDTEWFGNNTNPKNIKMDFRYLAKDYLDEFDVVILAAAHSSVKMCNEDKRGAFVNNVINFEDLINKLSRQKFIYMGSSCVYNREDDELCSPTTLLRPPCDYLTMTKVMIDQIAQLSNVEYYGLRLGSVAGYSKNFRSDLLVNAMTLSAITTAVVRVSNEHAWRPVLSTLRLSEAVRKIVDSDIDNRGIYNLFDFNITIGGMGNYIALDYNIPLIKEEGNSTYSFRMKEDESSLLADVPVIEPSRLIHEIADNFAHLTKHTRLSWSSSYI